MGQNKRFETKDLDYENDPRLCYDINGNLRKNNLDEQYLYPDPTTDGGPIHLRVRTKAPFSLDTVKWLLGLASVNLYGPPTLTPDTLLEYEKECFDIQEKIRVGVMPNEVYFNFLSGKPLESNSTVTELHKELDIINKEMDECARHYSPELYNKKRELIKKIKLLERKTND